VASRRLEILGVTLELLLPTILSMELFSTVPVPETHRIIVQEMTDKKFHFKIMIASKNLDGKFNILPISKKKMIVLDFIRI
jgi:hypothetical protein